MNGNRRHTPWQGPEIEQSAFTLAELVVVLTVVGIMLAIGFIKLSRGQRETQIHAAAAQLAADLQFAQETAMATGREVRVHFDIENNRYFLTWADGSMLQTPAGHRPFIVPFGQGRFKAVHLEGSELQGHMLRFRPDGHAMENNGDFTGEKLVANLNGQYAIYVQASTGSVRMVRGEDGDD